MTKRVIVSIEDCPVCTKLRKIIAQYKNGEISKMDVYNYTRANNIDNTERDYVFGCMCCGGRGKIDIMKWRHTRELILEKK